jgi:tetratricopeptide (TPR) repeat protein
MITITTLTILVVVAGIIYTVASILALKAPLRINFPRPACLHSIGEFLEKSKDFKTARDCFSFSLKSANFFAINPTIQASTYYHSAVIAHSNNEHANAWKLYIQALTIANRYNDLEAQARLYHQLGVLAQDLRDFTEAERLYIRSAEISMSLPNTEALGPSLHQLGVLEHTRNNIQAARTYYFKALEVFSKSSNNQRAAFTLYQIALITEKQGRTQEAVDYYHASIAKFKRSDIEESNDISIYETYTDCLIRIAHLYVTWDCWVEVENYSKTALAFLHSHSYESKTNSIELKGKEAIIYNLLKSSAIKQGRMEEAEKYSVEKASVMRFLQRAITDFRSLCIGGVA